MKRNVTMFFILATMLVGIIVLHSDICGQQVEVEPDGTVKVCSEIGSGPNSIRICF